MKTVIIFNAPPNSGKDACCEYLAEKYGAFHTYFKKALYQEAARISGLPLDYIKAICSDREVKERKNDCLVVDQFPVTPRQYLIHVSENVIKPLLGKDYFGKKLANEVVETNDDLIVVSDGGFAEELLVFKDYTQIKVVVIQLYREGCTFDNDSRRYFDRKFLIDNKIDSYELLNYHDLDTLYVGLDNILQDIKGE